MDFKLMILWFTQFTIMASSRIEVNLPQVREDVNEASSNVRHVWTQPPQIDLKKWRYVQQQNADRVNRINVVGKRKREARNLFSLPPLYLIQQVPINHQEEPIYQPNYQIEVLNELIGKTPQVQLMGLKHLLAMDKPITENVPDVANPGKQPNVQVNDSPRENFLIEEPQQPEQQPIYQSATEPSVIKKDGDGVSIFKNSSKSRKTRAADDYYYYEYEVVEDGQNSKKTRPEVVYEYIYEDETLSNVGYENTHEEVIEDEEVRVSHIYHPERYKNPPVGRLRDEYQEYHENDNYNKLPMRYKNPTPSGGYYREDYEDSDHRLLVQYKKNPPPRLSSHRDESYYKDSEDLDQELRNLLERRKRLQISKREVKDVPKPRVKTTSYIRSSPMTVNSYRKPSPYKIYNSIPSKYFPLVRKHLKVPIHNRREAEELPEQEEEEVIEEEEDVYTTIQEEYLTEDKQPVNLIVINNSNDNHRSKESKNNDNSKTEIVKKIPIDYHQHPTPIKLLPAPNYRPKPPHHHHHYRRPPPPPPSRYRKSGSPPARPYVRQTPKRPSKRVIDKINSVFSRLNI